jgi:HD-like signal output (HDOD) protein
MSWSFFKKSSAKTLASLKPIKNGTGITLPMDYLQKLIPLGDLPIEQLRALPATEYRFKPGEIIINRGEKPDALIYLYKGQIYLEAANGCGYVVDDSMFKACYPLSADGEQCFTVIAKSQASVICFPLAALKQGAAAAFINSPLLSLKTVPVEIRYSDFFTGFCNAYRKDDLRAPGLPDIALRLRKVLEQELSIAKVVDIINLDPVISSKLIQVANSPLYRPVNAIASCLDAVYRLGLKTTQNLVTTLSLYNLFRSNNQKLNELLQVYWRQSIEVSCLSYTLAGLTDNVNPDEALLAGLVHNIGALPIITFADRLENRAYTLSELDLTIATLQALIGCYILKKWNFPSHLQSVPAQSASWYYNVSPHLQVGDIVLLARFHSQLYKRQGAKLPPLYTLPAFLKLGSYALTPDLSLQLLRDARQQIADAMAFFKN